MPPSTRIAYLGVADQLRERILAGKLVAGDRLPSEAELCGQFGVSRSTIREALRILSSRHLLTTSRGVGGGSQVAQIDHDDVSQMLQDFIILLTQSEGISLAELLEARDLMEVPATRLAASRRTEAQLARLRATIPETDDPADVVDLNRRFHHVLLELAGNRLLTVLTEPMFRAVQTRFVRNTAILAMRAEITADHVAIVEAVEAGDAERAGHEMAGHLRRLRSAYRTADGPPPPT